MHLNRRNFLKAKGAVLSLPFLPSLLRASDTNANDSTPSKKLMLMYIPNGIVRRCFFPGEEEAELPAFIGGFNADKTKKERRLENVHHAFRSQPQGLLTV